MWFTLVVLAAGMWSRYGWLKQIDWFWPNNEPILLYSIYDAVYAWCTHIVFVIREEFHEAFHEAIWKKVPTSIRVSYVYQTITSMLPKEYIHLAEWREKPRGTAHATLVARDVVQGPFAVINADDFYGRDAFVQIATFLTTCTPHDIGMVGYVLKNTLSPYWSINRWVCAVQWGQLEKVTEHLKIQQQEDGKLYDEQGMYINHDAVVSMNFWWFHQSFFEGLYDWFVHFLNTYTGKGEYFIPTVVDTLIHTWKKVTCKVLMSDDQRCGVSYQEDKPFVQSSIAALHAAWVYPEQLFS